VDKNGAFEQDLCIKNSLKSLYTLARELSQIDVKGVIPGTLDT
jgi:hypothetical protein